MKKRSLAALGLVLAMLLAMFPAVSAAGTVTRTIASEAELRAFAQEVNAGHSFEGELVVLAQDIVLNTRVVDTQGNLNPGNYNQWTCIGTQENPFRGSFGGQGHTITGLYLLNYHALRPIRLKTWILLSRGPKPGCSSEFTLKRSQE